MGNIKLETLQRILKQSDDNEASDQGVALTHLRSGIIKHFETRLNKILSRENPRVAVSPGWCLQGFLSYKPHETLDFSNDTDAHDLFFTIVAYFPKDMQTWIDWFYHEKMLDDRNSTFLWVDDGYTVGYPESFYKERSYAKNYAILQSLQFYGILSSENLSKLRPLVNICDSNELQSMLAKHMGLSALPSQEKFDQFLIVWNRLTDCQHDRLIKYLSITKVMSYFYKLVLKYANTSESYQELCDLLFYILKRLISSFAFIEQTQNHWGTILFEKFMQQVAQIMVADHSEDKAQKETLKIALYSDLFELEMDMATPLADFYTSIVNNLKNGAFLASHPGNIQENINNVFNLRNEFDRVSLGPLGSIMPNFERRNKIFFSSRKQPASFTGLFLSIIWYHLVTPRVQQESFNELVLLLYRVARAYNSPDAKKETFTKEKLQAFKGLIVNFIRAYSDNDVWKVAALQRNLEQSLAEISGTTLEVMRSIPHPDVVKSLGHYNPHKIFLSVKVGKQTPKEESPFFICSSPS